MLSILFHNSLQCYKNADLVSFPLLYPECPVGGAPSLLSRAPQTPHICPPSISASNRSAALLTTCPRLPHTPCTTSGSTHPTWLTGPLQSAIRPIGRRSFPKPATCKMRRRKASRSGSQSWTTAGRDNHQLPFNSCQSNQSDPDVSSLQCGTCLVVPLTQSWSLLAGGSNLYLFLYPRRQIFFFLFFF